MFTIRQQKEARKIGKEREQDEVASAEIAFTSRTAESSSRLSLRCFFSSFFFSFHSINLSETKTRRESLSCVKPENSAISNWLSLTSRVCDLPFPLSLPSPLLLRINNDFLEAVCAYIESILKFSATLLLCFVHHFLPSGVWCRQYWGITLTRIWWLLGVRQDVCRHHRQPTTTTKTFQYRKWN